MCGLTGAPCGPGEVCSGGQCVGCIAECCPSCAGKCAGAPDGCGGVCPEGHCDGCCTDELRCVPTSEQSDLSCGAGGARCERCLAPESCGGGAVSDACGCTPDCGGKCGGASDGCGGACDAPCVRGHDWDVDDWGACSTACGGGVRGRKVLCRRDDGVIVADTFCPPPKPVVVESCNGAPCCLPDCAGKCGGASDGCGGTCNAPCCVPDCAGKCGGASDGCGGTCNAPCSTYAWRAGNWGACSVSCGGGTQSRPVWCERNDGVVVPDALCGGARPSGSQSCNPQACCVPSCEGRCGGASDGCGGTCNAPCATYGWVVGGWGACSVACGGGTQTRSVVCQRNDGVVVADSACSAPKPAASQVCNTQACCVPSCVGRCGGASDGCGGVCNAPCLTYAWAVGSWSDCSAVCGEGIATRWVGCMRSDGAVVSDAYCVEPRPSASETCNRVCCPPWPGGHVLCLEPAEFEEQRPCLSTEAISTYYMVYTIGGASLSQYRANNRTGTCAEYCASHPGASGC